MEERPSLLGLAAQTLGSGRRHTLELAREVLGLTGNPAAASKAVFTLLGRDGRFRVDSDGYWSLEPRASPPGAMLSRRRFAVVDVETTGGTRGVHEDRVTEVAVVHVQQGMIGETFETLVNPARPIPPRIQGFTGITDRMVAAAPYFEAVAEGVADRMRGRIFVAHNVRFDWGQITRELLRSAVNVPEVERLCTVRLGRLLHPRLRSHGLDSLAAHYGIRFVSRHRAFGDAMATARLLLALLREAETRGITDLTTLREALRSAPRRSRRGSDSPGEAVA